MESEKKRLVDLAVRAGRKRQSPRTGFVHLFAADTAASDTIPMYENFCFAIALLRQKTAESILEAKILIERLIAFQNTEGNFPIYLHDFPRAWDGLMALRIAPLFVQIERHFGAVLGNDLRTAIKRALERALIFSAGKATEPLWEARLHALRGDGLSPFVPKTAEEWFEWLVNAQISGCPVEYDKIPYHPELQVFIGSGEKQERGEPMPCPIEWALAESSDFSRRLLRDHPEVLRASPLFPLTSAFNRVPESYALITDAEGVRILWGEDRLHSFSCPGFTLVSQEGEQLQMSLALSDPVDLGRNDCIEAALFCDIAPQTKVMIEGRKGMIFRLGERVQIQTPSLSIELSFQNQEGSGDFCGQISRANRPAEKGATGNLLYEAFDWQISLRTLRRSEGCKITVAISLDAAQRYR
ncbi:MAG: hypothetical protein HY861_02145 [Chlamydiia bacterium]|nr:hypothetical protein [Chlamydiia bacterium]